MENICKNLNIRGEFLKLFDIKTSNTLDFLNSDFNKFGEYRLVDTINFKKDDVILDIGANVGTTSIYFAKKFPMAKIYAFEPVYYTWKNLKRNLHINNVKNIVHCENLAVSKESNNFLTLRL
jgi:tRNA G37 N-methylase Trm5